MCITPYVEVAETDDATMEPSSGHSFFRDSLKSVITRLRDEEYPMFSGRRIRFKQLMDASELYYYRRSHTDWEG